MVAASRGAGDRIPDHDKVVSSRVVRAVRVTDAAQIQAAHSQSTPYPYQLPGPPPGQAVPQPWTPPPPGFDNPVPEDEK